MEFFMEIMEQRFVVFDWTDDYACDTRVYTSAEEANRQAARLWDHLTTREKKHRHIYAGLVRADQIDPSAFEEFGDDAWELATDSDSFPGAFNSDEME